MKRKILSLLLAVSLFVPAFVFNVSAEETIKTSQEDKDIMEEYIRNLIEGKENTYVPFGEYDKTVYQQIENIDYEKFVNDFYVNDFDWDTIWKDYLGLWNINAYEQEVYESLFSELIEQLGKNSLYFAEKESDENFTLEHINEKIDKLNTFEQDRIKEIKEALDAEEALDKILDTRIKSEQYNATMYEVYDALKNNKETLKEMLDRDVPELLTDITELSAIIMYDYESSEKYLEEAKRLVYQVANKQADEQKAIHMKKAIDNICFKYQNELTNMVTKYKKDFLKAIESEIVKQSKAVVIKGLDDLIPKLGLATVIKKMLAGVDLAIFVKNLYAENSGMKKEVESTAAILGNLQFHIAAQSNFVEEGRNRLSDGEFSNEDYEAMSLLFDICRGTQTLNYNYINYLDYDGFWDRISMGLGTGDVDYPFVADILPDGYLIDRYLKYEKQGLERNIVEGDQCGETLYWEMDENGELTIFGEGEMEHSGYKESTLLLVGFRVEFQKWDNEKVKSVVFEGNVTSIGDSAFGGNSANNSVADSRYLNLKSITIPDTVKGIGASAFSNCVNLEKVILPDGLEYISASAFNGCENLKEISIPDSVLEIGKNAFAGTGITEFTFPSKIKKFNTGLFDNSKLRILTISESIENIPGGAFAYVPTLETVYMLTRHTMEPWHHSPINNYSPYKFTLYGYENAETWATECNKPANQYYWPYECNQINYKKLNENDYSENLPPINSTEAIHSAEVTEVQGDEYTFKVVTSLDIADIFVEDYITSNMVEDIQSDKFLSLKVQTENNAKVWTFKLKLNVENKKEFKIFGYDDDGTVITNGSTVYIEKNKEPDTNDENSGKRFVDVYLNGSPIVFDVKPHIVKNRTMVPLVPILEDLKLEYEWNESERTVNIYYPETDITAKLTIDSDRMATYDAGDNAQYYYLDSPAIIVNDRTLLPIRAIAEFFGYIVEWEDSISKVSITK